MIEKPAMLLKADDTSLSLRSDSDAECFLCAPSSDLLVLEGSGFTLLAGLGPIVDGYSVLAAKTHLESMADLPIEMRSARDGTIADVRRHLHAHYGSCLITEHGRTALCVERESQYDAHCLHAHFLLFPGAADTSEKARSFFSNVESFATLADAMSYAALCREYFLVSPEPEIYRIFSDPLNMPRQLARILVAHEFNVIHLADWKDHPNRNAALANASQLRSLLTTGQACHA